MADTRLTYGDLRRIAREGNTSELEAWIARGGDVNAKPYGGYSPALYTAALEGHCDVIRLLLTCGADPDYEAHCGYTSLKAAAGAGHHRVVNLLLDAGAQINYRSTGDGGGGSSTPMHSAASSGRVKMVRHLLSRGAIPDAGFSYGRDAEQYASHRGRPKVASCLAEVRLAGGWQSFVRKPRLQFLLLRCLCSRGRAAPPAPGSTHDLFYTAKDATARLEALNVQIMAAASLSDAQALAATAATSPTPPGLYQRLFPSEDDELLPKELFWHIFSFWRSTRDFVSADDDAYSDDEGPHDY